MNQNNVVVVVVVLKPTITTLACTPNMGEGCWLADPDSSLTSHPMPKQNTSGSVRNTVSKHDTQCPDLASMCKMKQNYSHLLKGLGVLCSAVLFVCLKLFPQ